MANDRSFWLVKAEPDCFSIDDLAQAPKKTTCWDGVRNYQARNYMRDGMRKGDGVLFYHSGGPAPAVAGTATVVREAYPDGTARDPADQHYDPKATAENPIWQMVDIRLETIFPAPVALEYLRKIPSLKNMELLRKGSRLSVQPVRPSEFETIVELAQRQGAAATSPKPAKKLGSKSAAKRRTTARR